MSEPHSEDLFSQALSDPLVGTTIQDRYHIEKKLGQGGMGAVYLAEHVLIQKKVAIKCLHPGLASNADVVRRFHNEALAATAIGHPNIVDVTDMGRFEDGTFFMALEYLAGRDWQEDLDQGGPQSLERVAHIGTQICDALEAASAKGIVHRDLKPENIFLVERHGDSDFVKVLDFGISKFHDGIGGSTRTGEIMGTPYYMAPEQIRGDKNISHIADIYALGVIFYQALTGLVPFDAASLPALILKIATEPAPELKNKLHQLPSAMNELVAKMLLKTPHERPQTFEAIAQALAPFLPPDSRLAQSNSRGAALASTAIGGSVDVPAIGEPLPERPRAVTPVGARGQDTSAGGTPGMLAQTEHSQPPPAGAAELSSTSKPHSISTNARLERQAGKASAKTPLLLTAGALSAALVWFVIHPPSSTAAPEQLNGSSQSTSEADKNQVRVQISTLPPDAELMLDGEPISNPFDAELTKDEKTHVLLAKRDGFADVQKKMVLKSGQRIFIPLSPMGLTPPLSDAPPVAPLPQSRLSKDRPKTQLTIAAPAPTKAPMLAPETVVVAAPAPVPSPAPSPAPVVPATPQPTPASDLKKIF